MSRAQSAVMRVLERLRKQRDGTSEGHSASTNPSTTQGSAITEYSLSHILRNSGILARGGFVFWDCGLPSMSTILVASSPVVTLEIAVYSCC